MKFTEDDVIKAKSMTAEAFKENGINDFDLSYITIELLELYETAIEKDSNKCEVKEIEFSELFKSENGIDQNYPCYIGHTPVNLGNTEWAWQNNNSSDGCDVEANLCGSGYRWKAKCSRYQLNRYCSNGKSGFIGWPF